MAIADRTILVAAAQLPAVRLGDSPRALRHIETAFKASADRNVDLLVLPECAYPAYLLGSVEDYARADHLSRDSFLERLGEWAASARLHAVCGFVEEREGKLYNAAALVDPKGKLLGIYHKSFLWGDDQVYFSPGEHIRVFDTPLGRIGAAICADLRAPEVVASLADQGAEIIAFPTCWVTGSVPNGAWPNPQPEFLVPARAKEFGLPFICANKFGAESDTISYCGLSRILNGDGAVVAEAEQVGECLIIGSIQTRPAHRRVIPTWAAARILTPEPAVQPIAPDESEQSVKIAVIPDAFVDRKRGTLFDADLPLRLADQEVEVVIAHLPSAAKAKRLEWDFRSLGMTAVTTASENRVLYESFGSYGCVSGSAALSFAPLRALALDGAALLVAFSVPEELELLRARALENRCFLAATFADSAFVVAPDGRVLARSSPADQEPLVVSFHLSEAANKQVFKDTHIWEQRRPEVYAAATHLGLDV